MDIRVFVLADGRAAPTNYRHVLVNPLKIDWLNRATNYKEVITNAVDAFMADGRAFVTEFGRTPGAQGLDGRDHHPYGFTVWLAGGGIKGGVTHGATDEIGFHAVENRHYVTDIHATILHQLGLAPRKLEVPGRKRLDIDFGAPIREILA